MKWIRYDFLRHIILRALVEFGGPGKPSGGGWRLGKMKHKMDQERGSERQPDQPPPLPQVS